MSKVVTAEYDAEQKILRLAEPLEGVKDHDQVTVLISRRSPTTRVSPDPLRPWLACSGILSKEDGEDLARALEILEKE